MDYRKFLSAGSSSDLTSQGYEGLVQCPYDPVHQIMSFRLQTHLFKCRRNHKHLKYVKCPFNGTHEMPEQELRLHVTSCSDKESFDRYKYCVSTSAATFVPEVESTVAPPVVDSSCTQGDGNEESWEPEVKLEAYNAKAHAKSSGVIRKCTGMAPSSKKFREAERQRIQAVRRQPYYK